MTYAELSARRFSWYAMTSEIRAMLRDAASTRELADAKPYQITRLSFSSEADALSIPLR